MPSLHFILQQPIPNMLFSDYEENITNTTLKVVAAVFGRARRHVLRRDYECIRISLPKQICFFLAKHRNCPRVLVEFDNKLIEIRPESLTAAFEHDSDTAPSASP